LDFAEVDSGRGAPAQGGSAQRLANEIKRRRLQVGRSQRTLASMVGYTRQYVTLAERVGHNLPSAELVHALDLALGAGGELVALRAHVHAEQRKLRGRRAAAAEHHPTLSTALVGDSVKAREVRRAVGDDVGVEYGSRVPRPPLDGLTEDIYYLEGVPPYSRLILPAAPAPLLIVNLGAPFLIRAGTPVEALEYADGCAVTTPTRAWEFSYPTPTRSVGVHFKPWGLAPFLPMDAAELCDRPATVEQIWGRPAITELRRRLSLTDAPQDMVMVLEEELRRRLRVIDGLDLIRHTSSAIAATGGTAPISDLGVAARASSTYLAKRFKAIVGVTPKRLARSYRFSSTVLAIDVAAPIDWADVAAKAGYFDQAHFVHEFREFTGLTPTRYIEVRRRFLRDHPGHALEGWPLPAD
jgi:AraC-like DNA-binding protein/transcriptional regulator with XRE-family HTH domain